MDYISVLKPCSSIHLAKNTYSKACISHANTPRTDTIAAPFANVHTYGALKNIVQGTG